MYTRSVRTNKMSQKLRDSYSLSACQGSRNRNHQAVPLFTSCRADSDPRSHQGEKKRPHFLAQRQPTLSPYMRVTLWKLMLQNSLQPPLPALKLSSKEWEIWQPSNWSIISNSQEGLHWATANKLQRQAAFCKSLLLSWSGHSSKPLLMAPYAKHILWNCECSVLCDPARTHPALGCTATCMRLYSASPWNDLCADLFCLCP